MAKWLPKTKCRTYRCRHFHCSNRQWPLQAPNSPRCPCIHVSPQRSSNLSQAELNPTLEFSYFPARSGLVMFGLDLKYWTAQLPPNPSHSSYFWQKGLYHFVSGFDVEWRLMMRPGVGDQSQHGRRKSRKRSRGFRAGRACGSTTWCCGGQVIWLGLLMLGLRWTCCWNFQKWCGLVAPRRKNVKIC